ncbi:MAG: hypothetical protein AB7K71_11355, partial [Polyangiaceae bacterium]
MTPGLRAVYDELVARAVSERWQAETARLRGALSAQCGAFDRDHPAAATRDAASMEYALVEGGLAQAIASGLEDPGERGEAAEIAGAVGGLLTFSEFEGLLLADDLWTGASWWIAPHDDVGRDVRLQLPDSPVAQCHVVVQETGCVLLPGVTFHPADALEPIRQTLARARALGLTSQQVRLALLKMEHSWQTLSRVKVGFAYRPE